MRVQHLTVTAIFAFIVSLSLNAQTVKTNYEKEWKKIDSIVSKKGLTRSALPYVDRLYAAAKREKNDAQVIKSLIYKTSLQENLDEAGIVQSISDFEKEVNAASSVQAKAILRSVLAELYWRYFQQNRWKFYERTETVNFNKDDIATWGIEDFHRKISEQYIASLQNESTLQQTKLQPYDEIIMKGNARYLRPTLFDLLAHRALQYFRNNERYITNPAYAFEIDDPIAFADAATFSTHRFSSRDSMSLHLKALQLYQRLLGFRLKDGNAAALIDADIERISFVHMYSVAQEKDSLYKSALDILAKKYPNEKEINRVWAMIAEWHIGRGRKYSPTGDTTYRYELVVAKEICEKIVAQKDSSIGKMQCQNLLKMILEQGLEMQAEKVNVPNQPFRLAVGYKNFTQLHFRLIKANRALREKMDNGYDQKFWQEIVKLPATKTFSQALPATNDHQTHLVEVKIDELPVGEYALLASPDKDFSLGSNPTVLQYFYVSNIAYFNNGNDFFAVNRETGSPIEKATVQVWRSIYDYNKRKWVIDSSEKLTTDKNGFFRVRREEDNNRQPHIKLQITANGDQLFMNDQAELYRYYEPIVKEDNAAEYEKQNRHVYLFTDRSIYRPGQTLYFKGILITRDFKTRQPKIAAGIKTWVRLHNTQGDPVDSVQVTTSEFGSYSGKFTLPSNALNGSFRLSDDEAEGEAEFSIEEYKRPKFSVEFEKLKSTYRVNDSIELTGIAKAYAGNNIDGAKVSYRVVRTARFPYPWLYWKWGWPQSEEQEIAHGVVTTGADGKFTIKFLAIPDRKVNRAFEPIFNYQVTADVTDISGETRSGINTVSVSYKALQLDVEVPGGPALRADSLKKLIIRTTNLAGEFQPSKVNVAIYRLNAPQRLIRKRYWEQPDQFVMTKEEYLRHFPHDEYSDETKKESWARQEKVFDRTDSVRSSGEFSITGTFKAGWYVAEVTTTDKYGEPIKYLEYIQLHDPATGMPYAQTYMWQSNSLESKQPGETANIKTGSSASDVFLIQVISRQAPKWPGRRTADQNEKYTFSTLSNQEKNFPIQIREADRGGFAVSNVFVKHNRFYNASYTVAVPWSNKDLSISYETFRDKTLPGSEEKWKVKISGKNNEKVSAEILTSMYDASLDQFKSQQWNKPDVWPVNTGGISWNSNANFIGHQAMMRYVPPTYLQAWLTYDQLITNAYEHVARREMRHMRLPKPVSDDMAADADRLSSGIAGRVPGVQVESQEQFAYGYSLAKTQTANVAIRGAAPPSAGSGQLLIVDGLVYNGSIQDIDANDIVSAQILTGADATSLYGSAAVNGVVIITTKSGIKKKDEPVQMRKNFNETAFFFPDLKTDSAGNVEFSFTMPEALTQWKWMLLAHTKDLSLAYAEKTMVTQKELMVQPNIPRFVREGDRMDLSAKIANMGSKEVSGQIEMQLIDATTNQPVDGWFNNMFPNQYFTAGAGESTVINFTIQVPYQFNKPVIIRYVARAGNVSDGEENSIPVLSNRLLVTETLSLNIRGGGTKNFTFDKLLQSDKSETLTHHAVTVEFTGNPAWYAVQAIPYLMEYPYECAEQLWNRVYANALAAKIVNASPRIKEIFSKWKTSDTAALISNLQKNQELKSILLEETPWVLQAKNETEQRRRIALLFDMTKLSEELNKNLDKLIQMQSPNGGFVWFKGGPDDRYITQYILTGIGHLKKLNAIPAAQQQRINAIVKSAVPYLDQRIKEDYDLLVKQKADLTKQQIGYIQVHYLYMRSFFNEINAGGNISKPFSFYRKQAQQFWLKQNRYMQGLTALALFRTGDGKTATDILRSLKDNAIIHDELGMYWKDMSGGYYWHQAPIETQALLIEAFTEITKDFSTADALKTWLLKHKQTNNWSTTKATADACYALLLQGTNWLSSEPVVQIKMGDKNISSLEQKTEAGSGYFKKVFDAPSVNNTMGNISVNVTQPNGSTGQPVSQTAWGAVYWQYFENLDNITTAATPLKLNKKLFVERNTDRGPVLEPLEEFAQLKTGEKVKVRIELRVDRPMEYVHMKDMRAASLEPVNVLSAWKWQGGLGYYESTKDASTNFFFSYLPKGTYVFEYPLFVTHTGTFSNGITTIQCMYAPEFSSHSEGVKINVEGN